MQPFQHQQNLIGTFAQHKVAANLLTIMMLLSGVWALTKLNTQFLPNFALDIITVNVLWSGATAEDVETSITTPVEEQLRTLDGVRKMNSTSANNISTIAIEYEEGTDMGVALDQVKEQVALLRNLPETAEKPEISRIIRYDLIARLLVTGPTDTNELRHLAQRMERELLEAGISKVKIEGLPEQEIAVQVPTVRLEEMGLTLPQIASKISQFSRDLPSGSIGRQDIARQLRSLEQGRNELDFAQLPIISDQLGRLIRLEDIATIEKRPQSGATSVSYNGKPAVELQLMRTEQEDALGAAKILSEWLEKASVQLPHNVNLRVFDQAWELIDERISLLLKNGISSLILVVITLYLFLNGWVAFWVAMGIPISLMAMLAILYMVGGSINMVSLFAMIMALGMIVDDAIVVGEDAFTHYQNGERSLIAAEGGAQRMLAPVMSSSLTTMAAFFPLMLIGGIMGNILFDIPLVIICVLSASLIECFFALPGHLRQSFHRMHHKKPHALRLALEKAFNRFRDNYFRPISVLSVEYRWAMLASILAALILMLGLLAGGRIAFTFFPTPENTILTANVNFVAGTAPERVNNFLEHLEKTLEATNQELGGNLINTVATRHGSSIVSESSSARSGDQFGSLLIELAPSELRTVRNQQILNTWQAKVQKVPGLESLIITERRGGPPGRDIDIRLLGTPIETLKIATSELKQALATFPGVNGIEDDMPYGREQWIYKLTPQGIAWGLTVEAVSKQLRAAYDGQLVQIFQEGDDEIEVRVVLPDDERYSLASLENFILQLPNGTTVPFSTAVEVSTRRGFEAIRHTMGQLASQVSADVDAQVTNANAVISKLVETTLPDLKIRYGVNYSFEGRAADQAETLGDMKRGVIFAFILMYLILAWQFGSYGWPLVVMIAIPFGLVGALFGHWVMGIDMTLLSLFGFFGLSGIVVNDSIVLVTFYKELRAEGMPITQALVEASCQRLRAVLLTSLTTIFGLLPLVFETSLQAQFLIPMAVSISFGLMFSTILVLLAIPALLGIYEMAVNPQKSVETIS